MQRKPKSMQIDVRGRLGEGVSAKDLALGVIGQIGIDGATGHVIEYTGEAVRGLSMEGRMTLCNMSIEAGARAAMIAPDETTFAYMKGRRFVPRDWDEAVARWRALASDSGARYDAIVEIDASRLAPFVTWGTNPGMIAPVDGRIPELSDLKQMRIVLRSSACWNIWDSSRAPASKIFLSTAFSSAPAPTRDWKTCGPRLAWPRDIVLLPRCEPWSCRDRRP